MKLKGGLNQQKMKILKCPNCAREKEVEDNIIIVVCAGCQIAMLPLKNYKENIKTQTKHL